MSCNECQKTVDALTAEVTVLHETIAQRARKQAQIEAVMFIVIVLLGLVAVLK